MGKLVLAAVCVAAAAVRVAAAVGRPVAAAVPGNSLDRHRG